MKCNSAWARVCLITFVLTCVHAQETVKQAASIARWLVNSQVKGVVATFSVDHPSFPYGSLEDVCDDHLSGGHPFFLLPDIATTANNLEANPNASIALAVANCSNPNFDGMPYDAMACYRIVLSGTFSIVNTPVVRDPTNPDLARYYKCHPAARDWVDGQSAHTFYLWQMSIDRVYYVGGYGDLHYIGDIDLPTYYAVKPAPPPVFQ